MRALRHSAYTPEVGDETERSGFRGKWAPGGRMNGCGVAALFLLGLLFSMLGIVPVVAALPVLLQSERAWARVETVEQLADPKEYRVWVEFETGAGQKIRASYGLKDQTKVRRLEPGERVELFYAVGDPQRVELYSVQAHWAGSWMWLAPGIFLLGLGWAAMGTQRNALEPSAAPASKKRGRAGPRSGQRGPR